MRATRIAAVIFSAALAFVGANNAFAANPYKTPCTADGKRVCAMQNQAKAESCLRQHMDQLTPACKTYLTKKKG
ncbi:hypothetical protein [Mesorhizobium sp. SP-1A]|uniref:hypothetical protein n=1 Tax=Mesorhizobium sp. SP-1A TaxID=3077840 RepID=UPI0028F73A5A|nr:hypothetical protein [Mesorhizobium sp. SP-1A]